MCHTTEIYHHGSSSTLLFKKSLSLSLPPDHLLYGGKKLFTSHSYFSKTASPWCFWFRLTVTECRSRWIIPSIQTAAIVILKEQTYVGERSVDHFKGMMKAQCWIVQKEAPMSGWGRGRKGGKEKRKELSNNNPLSFSVSFYPSHTLFFHSALLFFSVHLSWLFEHFWFYCWTSTKAFFWEYIQWDICILLFLQPIDLIFALYVMLMWTSGTWDQFGRHTFANLRLCVAV